MIKMRLKRQLGLILFAIILSLQMTITINFLVEGLEREPYQVSFNFLYSGSPDPYGNQIRNVTVYQDDGGSWRNRGNLTHINYDANDEIEGIINQTTRFDLIVFLNYTYADTLFDVEYRTRVYISIDGEFTQRTMTYYDVGYETDGFTEYWLAYYRYDWTRPDSATTYDIRLEYSAGSQITVDNSQDLKDGITGGVTFAYPGEDNNPVSRTGWHGTRKGYGNFQWWNASGFKPLHGADEFTISIWFSWEVQSIYTAQYIFAQDIDSTHRVLINVRFGMSFQIADGTNSISHDHPTSLENYQDNNTDYIYHVVLSWDKDNNSGKMDCWLNNTLSTSVTGLTNIASCDTELELGSRNLGGARDRFFIGRYFHVAIYDRALNRSEVNQLYQGRPDYVLLDGLNNSWTFEEANYGYPIVDSDLHDGLGTFVEREQWDIDFESQTLSGFLWPSPYDMPYFYMFLGSMVFIPLSVFMMFRSVKTRNDEKFLFHMFLWAFMIVISFTLMVTSIYGG